MASVVENGAGVVVLTARLMTIAEITQTYSARGSVQGQVLGRDNARPHPNSGIRMMNDGPVHQFGSGRTNMAIRSKVRRRKRTADTFHFMATFAIDKNIFLVLFWNF
jgi:hypothetical protein